jgi:hypothetical protein
VPTFQLAPVHMARLLPDSRQSYWHDSKGPDLKKKTLVGIISQNNIKMTKI